MQRMTEEVRTPIRERQRVQPDAAVLESLDLDEHLANPAIKQRYVTAMFDVIAPRYDRFTEWFSFGMDAGWKRELLALAASGAPDASLALDLACGTGDLTLGLAATIPPIRVIGIDASREMLWHATARAPGLCPRQSGSLGAVASPAWCGGDMCELPFRDGSVDLVTAGYAVRNASSWLRALDEIVRVLRPGGTLVTLDFFKPSNPLWRAPFLLYLSLAGKLYGWLWHRVPAVYGYLGPSVAQFVTEREYARALEARGLSVLATRSKLLGGIAIHMARRDTPAEPAS